MTITNFIFFMLGAIFGTGITFLILILIFKKFLKEYGEW